MTIARLSGCCENFVGVREREKFIFNAFDDLLEWRGGFVVGRRACDLGVAGSRPGRDAAAQQP